MLIGIALPVLANDALVLPQGVGRVYLVPVYGWSTGAFDDDGEFEEYEDEEGALTLFNLGVATEYGITDQISLGVQWAPGYTFVGDFDLPEPQDNGTIRGANPLTVGTEIGVIGSRGWLQSDKFRMQAAVGFEVPFQPDWKEEGKKAADDEKYTNPQQFIFGVKPFWAVGGGLSFDYVVMDGLYLNLFSEFRQHFGRTFDITDFLVETTAAGDDYKKQEAEIEPFLEMDLEFDVDYTIALSDSVDLGLSLPVTYSYTPEITGTSTQNIDVPVGFGGTGGNDVESDIESDPSWTLTVGPTVSTFITALPVPLEFVGYWNWPVAGESTARTNQLVLETRVYFQSGAR